jgi:hypothetical protein
MSRSLTSWSSHWMVISVPLQDTVAAKRSGCGGSGHGGRRRRLLSQFRIDSFLSVPPAVLCRPGLKTLWHSRHLTFLGYVAPRAGGRQRPRRGRSGGLATVARDVPRKPGRSHHKGCTSSDRSMCAPWTCPGTLAIVNSAPQKHLDRPAVVWVGSW